MGTCCRSGADDSGLNSELYTGNVAFVPLTSTEAWETDFTTIRAGEHSAGAGTVHFHTANVVWMRRSLADATVGRLALSVDEDNNITSYTVPCDTTASLALTIAGTEYVIPPSAWVDPRPSVRRPGCLVWVAGISDEHLSADVYAGSPFLRTVYTVLRFGEGSEAQIGFAALSDAARAVVPQRIQGGATPTGVMPGYVAVPSSTQPSSGQGVRGSRVLHVAAVVLVMALF